MKFIFYHNHLDTVFYDWQKKEKFLNKYDGNITFFFFATIKAYLNKNF